MSRPVRETGQELADRQAFKWAQKVAREMGKAGKAWSATMVALYTRAPNYIRALSGGGLATLKLEWQQGAGK